MIIPSEFKIGHYTYKVVMKKRINRSGTCWGRSYLGPRVIHLATHPKKRALTEAEITVTFWHEYAHCMLYQMGHPLWQDEAFCDMLGESLERTLSTAKFKE
jgi:hypothetical protein